MTTAKALIHKDAIINCWFITHIFPFEGQIVYFSVLILTLSINRIPEVKVLQILIVFSQTSLAVFNLLPVVHGFVFLLLSVSNDACLTANLVRCRLGSWFQYLFLENMLGSCRSLLLHTVQAFYCRLRITKRLCQTSF